MRAVRALPTIGRGGARQHGSPPPNSTANCTPLAFAYRQTETRWLTELIMGHIDGQLPRGTDTIQVPRRRRRYRACFASTPARGRAVLFSRPPRMCTRYTSLLTTVQLINSSGLKKNRKKLGICMGLWSGNSDRFVIFVCVNIPLYDVESTNRFRASMWAFTLKVSHALISTNRVRASVWAFTLKVSHAPISVECSF